MVEAAIVAGVHCSWVLGDSVYSSDKSLRAMLEQYNTPYVLSVRSDEKLMITSCFQTRTALDIATSLKARDWHRLPAGQGSKGPRLYDWARVRLMRLQSPPWDHVRRTPLADHVRRTPLADHVRRTPLADHWLLIRRSISNPKDMAFYVTFGPHTTKLKELAAVAGLRWTIGECFQSAKGETGLDHCEARSWHGWHRHITLSMLAFAFLAGLRARLLEAQSIASSDKANKRSLPAAA